MTPDNSPVRLDTWAKRTAKPFDEMTWEERFFWCLGALCKMESRAETAERKLGFSYPLPAPVPLTKPAKRPEPVRPPWTGNAAEPVRADSCAATRFLPPPIAASSLRRTPQGFFPTSA